MWAPECTLPAFYKNEQKNKSADTSDQKTGLKVHVTETVMSSFIQQENNDSDTIQIGSIYINKGKGNY